METRVFNFSIIHGDEFVVVAESEGDFLYQAPSSVVFVQRYDPNVGVFDVISGVALDVDARGQPSSALRGQVRVGSLRLRAVSADADNRIRILDTIIFGADGELVIQQTNKGMVNDGIVVEVTASERNACLIESAQEAISSDSNPCFDRIRELGVGITLGEENFVYRGVYKGVPIVSNPNSEVYSYLIVYSGAAKVQSYWDQMCGEYVHDNPSLWQNNRPLNLEAAQNCLDIAHNRAGLDFYDDTCATGQPAEILYGDLNADGSVDSFDAECAIDLFNYGPIDPDYKPACLQVPLRITDLNCTGVDVRRDIIDLQGLIQ